MKKQFMIVNWKIIVSTEKGMNEQIPYVDNIEDILLFENDKDTRKYIVFLTDGQDNATEETSYDDIISKAKKKDIRILTVGLGSEVDSSNLQNIASLTNGKYFYADSSTDLYKFDYKIFAEIE